MEQQFSDAQVDMVQVPISKPLNMVLYDLPKEELVPGAAGQWTPFTTAPPHLGQGQAEPKAAEV